MTGSSSENLSSAQAVNVSRSLIDASQAGGYSAIATQFHVDYYQFGSVGPWVDGTLAYAASQQVPIWPAGRWLAYTEARDLTAIAGTTWNAGTGTLTFTVTVPDGAEAQTLMLPDERRRLGARQRHHRQRHRAHDADRGERHAHADVQRGAGLRRQPANRRRAVPRRRSRCRRLRSATRRLPRATWAAHRRRSRCR